jgi:hypothetical protein
MDHNTDTAELADKYPDLEQRARLIDFELLEELLGDCIIDRSYKVPTTLADALKLTPAGQRSLEELRKKGCPYNEGRLLCFLVGFDRGLIDFEASNCESAVKAIDIQIKNREILFPSFTIGRFTTEPLTSSARRLRRSIFCRTQRR